VEKNIALPLEIMGYGRAERQERIDRLLDLVDLAGFGKKFPWQLSGGMQQRASIARALVFDADLLLMDEPFGALDPLTRDALGDDYRELHRKLGLTTVMITHDMTEAILLADRIAVMRGGKLLARGTPAELAASGDAYVGELLRTPRRQAERLNEALPHHGGGA
jgi:osmoprotectant transport system ATP-binding protein